ncbi:MAG: DNA-binding protein [Syntrophus sp. (in: bacteria)]|nr:DNA-binding protein [Syntrophus sp. (in: bacteria)]
MEIMTVKEVANFLRLKEATVCRLASEGKLPGVKVGKSWRFDRAALERLVTGAQSDMIGATDGGTKNQSGKH